MKETESLRDLEIYLPLGPLFPFMNSYATDSTISFIVEEMVYLNVIFSLRPISKGHCYCKLAPSLPVTSQEGRGMPY